MMARPTLLMRHGGLWLADPWYRVAWLAGPQAMGLVALAWLFASPDLPQAPPLPSVSGHWLHPIHSDEELASLRKLRDQATTDPGARAQLDHQALTGNSLAQFFMGTLYDPYLRFHPVDAADPKKALGFYDQAAHQGVDSATVNMGIMLLAEQDFGITEDYAEARRLFEHAAPTSSIATRLLGVMRRNGWGEPMDPAGGMQLIRTAAERGEAVAQRLVGLAYDKGDNGLPHDPSEAVAWFQKAAAQGDPVAQRLFGTHLKTGDGIAVDVGAALDWFRKAAAQGDTAAQKEVDVAPAPP